LYVHAFLFFKKLKKPSNNPITNNAPEGMPKTNTGSNPLIKVWPNIWPEPKNSLIAEIKSAPE